MTGAERKELEEKWTEIAALVSHVSIDKITDNGDVFFRSELTRRVFRVHPPLKKQELRL